MCVGDCVGGCDFVGIGVFDDCYCWCCVVEGGV